MKEFNLEELTEEKKLEVIEKASNEASQKDYFQKLRERIAEYIEKNPNAKGLNYLLMVPDFFYLICRLLGDSRVPTKNKLKIGAAILYCVSPIDLIPDFMGVGLTDDILIIVKILSDLINSVDNEIICELWVGEENIIKIINDLADMVEDLFKNSNMLKKVSEFMETLKK